MAESVGSAAVIQKITDQTLNHAPAAVAAILAVEQAAKGQPGTTKREIAVQTIQASARAAQGVTSNTSVQNIGLLVDLFCSVFNAVGLLKK